VTDKAYDQAVVNGGCFSAAFSLFENARLKKCGTQCKGGKCGTEKCAITILETSINAGQLCMEIKVKIVTECVNQTPKNTENYASDEMHLSQFSPKTRKHGKAERDGRPLLLCRRRTVVTTCENLVTMATGIG